MQTFQLTRKEMANLLLSLEGDNQESPISVLKEAWIKRHTDLSESEAAQAFMTTKLPTIFETLIKNPKKEAALSITEIVALGNQIEQMDLSLTAVQNWVKRDAKEIIGPPEKGKKYSIYQASLLFIIEDLKNALDFKSIKQLLKLIFNAPIVRTDDLIPPLSLFLAYGSIFEDLDPDGDQIMEAAEVDPILALTKKEKTLETLIENRAAQIVNSFEGLTSEQKQCVQNTIVILTLTIQMSYLKSLAKRYTNSTLLFLNKNTLL